MTTTAMIRAAWLLFALASVLALTGPDGAAPLVFALSTLTAIRR